VISRRETGGGREREGEIEPHVHLIVIVVRHGSRRTSAAALVVRSLGFSMCGCGWGEEPKLGDSGKEGRGVGQKRVGDPAIQNHLPFAIQILRGRLREKSWASFILRISLANIFFSHLHKFKLLYGVT
jgi:hypothetical protein